MFTNFLLVFTAWLIDDHLILTDQNLTKA